MPDNDYGPLSEAEQHLISFVQSVRPESASLLKLRSATEAWLWPGKLCAIFCAVVVFEAALLNGWYDLPALLAVIGASTPLR